MPSQNRQTGQCDTGLSKFKRRAKLLPIFDTFIRLWAAAALFSLFSSLYWAESFNTFSDLAALATFYFASAIVFFGARPPATMLFLVSFFCQALLELPYLTNHRFVMAFFNMLLICGLAKDFLETDH